jgi:RND superfamily putative drug exporter
MFERWGRIVYRRRWAVLAVGATGVVLAGVWGLGVFGSLSDGGFEDPDSEATRAAQRIERTLGRTDAADVVALYRSPSWTVDDQRFEQAVVDTLAGLPADEVAAVNGYYQTGAPAFVSEDRHSTYVSITLAGDTEEDRTDGFAAIRDELEAPGLETRVGGNQAVFTDVNEQVARDIGRAEALSMPIVLILSLLIFGGLVAATLPIGVGMIAILGAFALLRAMTLVGDVSVFSINVITLLGLGLAIDYALFVVSRFREELAAGSTVEQAVARTVSTAGRTVVFSGLTVAAALASLLLFPQNFLRSMGFGGMAAVLVAMLAALTMLPALLSVLGHRVDAGGLPFLRRTRAAHRATGGVWTRIAHTVMRRPLVFASAIVVALLALGAPFLRVEWGGVDARALPEGTPSRVVSESLADDFAAPAEHARVVISGASRAEVGEYVAELSGVDGVDSVDVAGERRGTTVIDVGFDADPQSEAARDLVRDLRSVPAPAGAIVLVGGETAALLDLLDSLGDTLPLMGLVVAASMLVLLFLAFGSVVLPFKAMAMNVVSIAASFGVVVWIFQDGHLSGLLGFTSTGTVEATQPVLMLAILFGLSMDYEVFLLSRVREQWDRTHDNTAAVAAGLQRTGRIITSAALLLIVVIGAFATSGITFIKMIGVGMIVAILVDATVVRALLVPATMRLLGSANWWAPAPLRRAWARFGFREDVPPAPDVPAADEQRVPAGVY